MGGHGWRYGESLPFGDRGSFPTRKKCKECGIEYTRTHPQYPWRAAEIYIYDTVEDLINEDAREPLVNDELMEGWEMVHRHGGGNGFEL